MNSGRLTGNSGVKHKNNKNAQTSTEEHSVHYYDGKLKIKRKNEKEPKIIPQITNQNNIIIIMSQ